jgi:hypothetical protein
LPQDEPKKKLTKAEAARRLEEIYEEIDERVG